jgi:hypothetical protein
MDRGDQCVRLRGQEGEGAAVLGWTPHAGEADDRRLDTSNQCSGSLPSLPRVWPYSLSALNGTRQRLEARASAIAKTKR